MITSLWLLLLVGVGAFLSMRIFTVNRIEVDGCVLRNAEEVRELSGIAMGSSVLRINNADVRDGVERSPYFVLERIELLLPDGVRLIVTERQPHAVIHYLNALIVTDENGLILDIAQELGNVRCPVVTGMEVSSFQIGQAVESYESEKVDAMNALLKELDYQDCAYMVSELNVSDLLNLRVYLVDGLSVKLGNANNLREKVRWMRGAVAEISRRGLGMGELDVSTVASGKLATFLPESARSGITVGGDVPEGEEDGFGAGGQDTGDEGDTQDAGLDAGDEDSGGDGDITPPQEDAF